MIVFLHSSCIHLFFHATGFPFSLRRWTWQVQRSFFGILSQNSLLTKLIRSRWLDIGFVLFFVCLWTSTSSQSINMQKRMWPISGHLDLALGQKPIYLSWFPMHHHHIVHHQISSEISQILLDLNIHCHQGRNGQRYHQELPCKTEYKIVNHVKWSLGTKWLIVAWVHPDFCSMKWLRLFGLPLERMLVHRRPLPHN